MDTHPLLLINPNSANGKTAKLWPKLRPLVEAELGPIEERFTTAPGEATEICRQALREGPRWIILVGGDGTLNEAVNGFFEEEPVKEEPVEPESIGSKSIEEGSTEEASPNHGPSTRVQVTEPRPLQPGASLSVITLGTGGDFRRSLGLQPDPIHAIKALKQAKERLIDLGRATYLNPSGQRESRYFVNVAGCGLSGRVAHQVNHAGRLKALGGKLGFLAATLTGMMHYKNARLQISVDGMKIPPQPFLNAVIANGRYEGGGMLMAPTASLEDGQLDLILMKDVGKLELIRNVRRIYRGTHLEHPKVELLRGKVIEIELAEIEQGAAEGSEQAEPVYLELDGETPGHLPARFQILPKALCLKV